MSDDKTTIQAESTATPPMDLDAVRARLAQEGGRRYWRSLDELTRNPEFDKVLEREFPRGASAMPEDGPSRRSFVKLMGASMALAGLTACGRQPTEYIYPFDRAPEHEIPGMPSYYATAVTLSGVASAVVAQKHEGRPTKLEGNPKHPVSRGKTSLFTQAEILGLYDPDRSHHMLRRGRPGTWEQFQAEIGEMLPEFEHTRGDGLYILSGSTTSPTMIDRMTTLRSKFTGAQWYRYEPVTRDAVYEAATLAFGRPMETHHRFDVADVVVSFDADFLCSGPHALRNARSWAERRRVLGNENLSLNRLYALESTPTLTGSVADHKYPLRPSQVEGLVRIVASRLGIGVAANESQTFEFVTPEVIDAIVADLEANRGKSIVIAGEEQTASTQALVHAINAVLGNNGQTVVYSNPVEESPGGQMAGLRDLVTDMKAGKVKLLVMLGGNPVYDTPADIAFEEALDQVGLAVHLSLGVDETSNLCHWHLPMAHDLESWGDARAIDGTVSIIQPMIAPLFDGKTPLDIVNVLLGDPGRTPYDTVQEHWRGIYGQEDAEGFERFWRTALADGFVADTALPAREASVDLSFAQALPAYAPSDTFELIFRADPTIYDGRFANNGWLQELPKPLTKTCWDNAVMIGMATSRSTNLGLDEKARVMLEDREALGGVYVLPGQPRNTAVVHLGYGRSRAGRVGDGAGFNVNALRTSDSPWMAAGAELRRTGLHYPIARTEDHFSIEHRRTIDKAASDRKLYREMNVAAFAAHPDYVGHMRHEIPDYVNMYPREAHAWDGHAWGMSIDLNSCTGCGACVVACQAENNIPIVGKDQVMAQRAMHWIRIDRYFTGEDLENPRAVNQPLACVHCEQAPCEVVCPVAATVHSKEGLNEMIYNRCVGTRYCSNNCPYKVRRFNFFHFSKRQYGGPAGIGWPYEKNTLWLARNPNVTVRSRGVMEKCTYCVQRISKARIEAKKDMRPIRDGEIRMACEQACPSDAIVFGDIKEQGTRLWDERHDPRTYAVLGDLNIRPRTTHMARLRNPNPALEPDHAEVEPLPGHEHGHEANGHHEESA